MPDLSQFKIDVDLPERQRQAMQFLANALSSLEQNGISVTKVVVEDNNYLVFTENSNIPISVTK
jgi:hypothetical protein